MTNHGNPYSPYKIAHHREKIDKMRANKQVIPAQVQIVISDLCNHNCSFCAYRMEGYTSSKNFGEWDAVKEIVNKNPNRMIPYEKIVEILDDCVSMGIPAIQLTGGGEPSVHPKYNKILQDILDRNLQLAVVSNGALMKGNTAELLAQSTWVRFSIDAGKDTTYSLIREVSTSLLDKTWGHIAQVVEIKRRLSTDTIIGIGFVVNHQNYKEILLCAQRAKEVGVDNIRISAAFTNDNYRYIQPFYDRAKELTIDAQKLSTEEFQVFNLFGDRISDLIDERPEYKNCGYMQLNTYIGGDQNVYRCCNTAYNERGLIGSIKKQSFKSLWLSEEKHQTFETFDARSCDRCMFNNKNRFINYLTAKNPSHINYI